ncbi:hypothetical protein IHE44_0008657 [Lamprotornis superbus]|uniref:Uncharacterized protein n=1 Tax=Lamprotornis superbus TaxID=245042 RepID=A0A835TVD9_9PASS|nr:hypothetical protein IHE44_0008657 [Lamprotornis superbus]
MLSNAFGFFFQYDRLNLLKTGLHKAFFHVLLAERDDFNQILYEWIRYGQKSQSWYNGGWDVVTLVTLVTNRAATLQALCISQGAPVALLQAQIGVTFAQSGPPGGSEVAIGKCSSQPQPATIPALLLPLMSEWGPAECGTVAGTASSGLTQGRGRGRNVLGVSSIGCSTGRNRSWDRGSGFKNKIQDKGCEQMPQPELAAAKPWLCHQPRDATNFSCLVCSPLDPTGAFLGLPSLSLGKVGGKGSSVNPRSPSAMKIG